MGTVSLAFFQTENLYINPSNTLNNIRPKYKAQRLSVIRHNLNVYFRYINHG